MFPVLNTVVAAAERLDGGSLFFSSFADAYSGCRGQIAKVETRQTYREPGNPSWEALEAGNLKLAEALIPEVRKADAELFFDLRTRGIDFIRVRPITFPLSAYMAWELKVYRFNLMLGEQIYAANTDAVREILGSKPYDFMVFDARVAFVHDYDAAGEICGGWRIDDQRTINSLLVAFGHFKANSQHISHFFQ